MIGKTLGHYQITNQLGKGGMGEVFQAKDQVLGRDVAIKVLPEEFARDADRVGRFQREAKVLASLNHPNIAAIHGLEQSEGTNFLVLELVEGETLADKIKTGPIPVEESLKMALQIAEALEAAHEKGVIHRDLKPANIKVTPDGKVKVLDFGLAKAYAGDREEVNLSNSPTLSNAATQQGVILGTAAYMSPEQARGDAVDKKADIWAFGLVLFEMLTGRGMFEGRTVSDTLAAVLMREPEWTRLPTNLSPRIRLLLEHCLEKEPKNRCGSIGEARADIQKDLADSSGTPVQHVTGVEPRTRLRIILPWAVAALVLGLIIAGVAVWKLKPSEPRQVTRLYYELPKEQQFGDLQERALAVSPDGRQFVYSTNEGLYLRSMEELDARLIVGTKGAQNPFFSPDGKWIGYLSTTDSQLKKIAITGGAPVRLTSVNSLGSFSWGADDAIVYGEVGKGIMRISSSGGNPELLVKGENVPIVHPQILPDGKSVLFNDIDLPYKIVAHSLKSGERKKLFEGDTAQYLPTGHIVYAVDNNLFAVVFDPGKLESTGGPISMVEGVLRAGGASQYAVSNSGTLVYIPGPATGPATPQYSLVWVDRNGKEERIAAKPDAYYGELKISPDGTRVALDTGTSVASDVWIWDFNRKTMTRLTFDKDEDSCPVWSPDGKRIAFHTHQKDARGSVYWKAADGTGKDEALGSFPGHEIFPWSWSGDGKTLFVKTDWISGKMDIGALSTEGDRKYRPLLKESYDEMQPQISPNGRWLAYTSAESGKNEIYVRPFPEVDKGKWQVSTDGGNSPLWSRDGREMFYRNGDAVLAVPVKTDPAFGFETTKVLFQGKYFDDVGSNPWDISPDGKRFLMIKTPASTGAAPTAAAPQPKITIVVNWFEELKQRVPTN